MEFLTGEELSESIYDTLYNAEKYLIIISPFIQLDNYFKDEVFKTHLNNSKVHIILGFGKNEENINRSFRQSDIDYFTQFPNVTIVYLPNLHAKYYGNEKTGIITSINLIDYSFKNNIEFGVRSQKAFLMGSKFFDNTQSKCLSILDDEGFTVFVKRPQYKRNWTMSKDFVGSTVEYDEIEKLISTGSIPKVSFSSFREEKYVNNALKEERKKRNEVNDVVSNLIQGEIRKITPINKTSDSFPSTGHCIRCKTPIPNNIEKPFCYNCYQTWSEFSNYQYTENYCLACGEPNDTSMARPACRSCYNT